MWQYPLWLLLGGVLLYFGAEGLVRGSAALALRFGISPLVVGLTVVAFGTSAPELVVSVQASLRGSGAIALGNVVGSNICNIALILGLCAVVYPMRAASQVVRREIPVMIGVTVLFLALIADGSIGRIDGAVLVLGVIGYTVFSIVDSRRATTAGASEQTTAGATGDAELAATLDAELPSAAGHPLKHLAFLLVGLGLLVVGADRFVFGAVGLARGFGVSEAVIGLTVIAIGTSLPELATSFVAALRKESDIAIGNVVGSNVFNLLAVIGVAGLVQPLPSLGIGMVDFGVMLGLAVALWPIAWSGRRISRLEGAALLAVYLGYMVWIGLHLSGAAPAPTAA